MCAQCWKYYYFKKSCFFTVFKTVRLSIILQFPLKPPCASARVRPVRRLHFQLLFFFFFFFCFKRNGCRTAMVGGSAPPGTAGHCTKGTLFTRGLCISSQLCFFFFLWTKEELRKRGHPHPLTPCRIHPPFLGMFYKRCLSPLFIR